MVGQRGKPSASVKSMEGFDDGEDFEVVSRESFASGLKRKHHTGPPLRVAVPGECHVVRAPFGIAMLPEDNFPIGEKKRFSEALQLTRADAVLGSTRQSWLRWCLHSSALHNRAEVFCN